MTQNFFIRWQISAADESIDDYTVTINTSIYWFVLIEITLLHIFTRVSLVFRPVCYTKSHNCSFFLCLFWDLKCS